MASPRKKKEKKPGRKKPCKFCMDHVAVIDYKDAQRLRKFMTDRGKIAAPRLAFRRRISRHHRRTRRTTAVPDADRNEGGRRLGAQRRRNGQNRHHRRT